MGPESCGRQGLGWCNACFRLGIRSILNCATNDLYNRSYTGGEPLREKLQGYKVQVLEADDVEEGCRNVPEVKWKCCCQGEEHEGNAVPDFKLRCLSARRSSR